jgi:hypothetical protein
MDLPVLTEIPIGIVGMVGRVSGVVIFLSFKVCQHKSKRY